jgi:hypothetical protein
MWAFVHTSEPSPPESVEAWKRSESFMSGFAIVVTLAFMLFVMLLFLVPTAEAPVKVAAPEEPKSALTVVNGHWVIVPPDTALCSK